MITVAPLLCPIWLKLSKLGKYSFQDCGNLCVIFLFPGWIPKVNFWCLLDETFRKICLLQILLSFRKLFLEHHLVFLPLEHHRFFSLAFPQGNGELISFRNEIFLLKIWLQKIGGLLLGGWIRFHLQFML